MEIFTPKNYSNTRSNEPIITIGLTGLIALNRVSVEKIGIHSGITIAFGKRIIENEVQYCLFINPEGFVLRKSSSEALQFNAKKFTEQITKDLDLALAPERKKSVRFNLKKDVWDEKEVWKLV